MRKALIAVLVCVLAMGFVSLALAEENKSTMDMGMMQGKGLMTKEMMQGKGMMMGKMGMCPMCSLMMKREVVATQDGGVVVIFANKMLKYDKDLNFVKETELKIDIEAMGKTMLEMKEKCPMCQKMKEKCAMKSGDEAVKVGVTIEPAK